MNSYSIAGFSGMVHDRVRMGAYESALKRLVKPGSVVVDIGAGTGMLSFVACQCGAEKVYAIEPNDAIHVAREIARASGLANRIDFIHGLSTDVTLEKKADVIVSDLRGIVPLFEHHLPTIMHARERLLAPGGRLIPKCDRLWAALVDSAKVYEDLEKCWVFKECNLDVSAIRKYVTNTPGQMRADPDQLLMDPQHWATLDYERLQKCNVEGVVNGVVSRDGVAHVLCVWFDTDLCDGTGFSNAPGQPKTIYGQWMLPLLEPIELAAGDGVELRINADLVGNDYVWRWTTRVWGRDNPEGPKTELRQSMLSGVPLSLESLRRQADDYVPELNKEGVVDKAILSSIAKRTPLGEIATEVTERFGDRFSDWKAALNHVGDLSRKYSR